MFFMENSLAFWLDKEIGHSERNQSVGNKNDTGLLSFEADEIILEFTAQKRELDDMALLKQQFDVQVRALPLSLIQTVEYKQWYPNWYAEGLKSFWNPKLVITVKSLMALEGIPNVRGNVISLTLEWKDRQVARALAAHITMLLAEERLKLIEEKGQKQLPPHS